ncbi:MAG: hypothetical protein WDA15_03510 [Trueperaceae bacterium]
MPREKVIGSYLLRLTDQGGRLRVQLRDLRAGEPLEFETWIAAWAYLDAVLHEGERPQDEDEGSRRQR